MAHVKFTDDEPTVLAQSLALQEFFWQANLNIVISMFFAVIPYMTFISHPLIMKWFRFSFPLSPIVYPCLRPPNRQGSLGPPKQSFFAV